MTDNHDLPDERSLLDELAAGDVADRELAASLRAWRDQNVTGPIDPDSRLGAMFSQESAPAQPGSWRQWMQRPAVAFGASFVAVLILGAGALAVVANSDGGGDVAASTSSTMSAQVVNSQDGEITLPEDLSEQTGYASCVFDQLTEWFDAGFAGDMAPQILDECGTPPIPDLGPEAAAFQDDLQAWANCAAEEVQALLPDLPNLIKEGNDQTDPLSDCGEPPDPRDYGLQLPFLDFGEIDPSKFDFGPFNLDDFKLKLEGLDLEGLKLEELLAKIPAGLLPEDLDLENLNPEDLKGLLEGFELEDLDLGNFDLGELKGFFEGFELREFDLESCDAAIDDTANDAPEVRSLEDLENLDFKDFFARFEGCGFDFFGSGDLDDLDFDMLFGQLKDLNIEGLQDLDLESLLSRLDN